MDSLSRLNLDRYHLTMANHAVHPGTGKWETGPLAGKLLGDTDSMWYLAQRKLPFAPVIGHERLVAQLQTVALDPERRDYIEADRASLGFIAKRLRHTQTFTGTIRTVKPGTILFQNEPFALITGPWALTELREVLFLHSFEKPTAVTGTAFGMRVAVGHDVLLSDMSLRRASDSEAAAEISDWAHRGLMDDTSNMEFAFSSGVPAIGTMAHFLVQAYTYVHRHPVYDEQGRAIHFETYAFMRWLDTHPNGTVLLIDTIDFRDGIVRAIEAALSSPERRQAFKGIRIDSGDTVAALPWIRQMLDANGLSDVFVVVTDNVDLKKIQDVQEQTGMLPYGFGVGASLAQAVSGVIFKHCAIFDGEQWLATSKNSPDKETLVGPMQIWRCIDSDGLYFKDVITLENEPAPASSHIKKAIPLLGEWTWEMGEYPALPSPAEQRQYIQQQWQRFRSLTNYVVEQSPLFAEKQRQTQADMKAYSYPSYVKIAPPPGF